MVWGALIGAAASIGGSLLDKKSADNQSDQQAAIAQQNLEMQEKFAREGIRWRVEDAKAAGIHPLYGLGAQIPTYSPTSYIPGDTRSVGSGIAAAGQEIGRAVDATRTAKERTDSRLEELALTRGELENELLRAQIAKLYQQPNPTLPALGDKQLIPGQADVERHGLIVQPASKHVVEKPQEVTVASPHSESQEPHPITDVGFVRTPTGLAPVPSKDAKERIEDQTIPELLWSLRNNLLPSLGASSNQPPKAMLPPGAYSWEWNVGLQEWQPVYHHPRSKPSPTDFWNDAARRGESWTSWSGKPYLGRSRKGSYW